MIRGGALVLVSVAQLRGFTVAQTHGDSVVAEATGAARALGCGELELQVRRQLIFSCDLWKQNQQGGETQAWSRTTKQLTLR